MHTQLRPLCLGSPSGPLAALVLLAAIMLGGCCSRSSLESRVAALETRLAAAETENATLRKRIAEIDLSVPSNLSLDELHVEKVYVGRTSHKTEIGGEGIVISDGRQKAGMSSRGMTVAGSSGESASVYSGAFKIVDGNGDLQFLADKSAVLLGNPYGSNQPFAGMKIDENRALATVASGHGPLVETFSGLDSSAELKSHVAVRGSDGRTSWAVIVDRNGEVVEGKP